MALTLGTTGMDAATESDVRAAFQAANAELGGGWTLVAGDDADFVVVDLDSLYGPMSWLRLHSTGRKVIGLTRVERSGTDYRLSHPVTADGLLEVMRAIAAGTGAPVSQDAPIPAPQPAPEPAIDAPPPACTPAPSPMDVLPPAEAVHADPTETAPDEAPDEAPVIAHAAVGPEPEPLTQPGPEPAAPDRPLHAWLSGNDFAQPIRVQRGDGPAVLLDPVSRTWHGPLALKALAPYFDGTWQREDFAELDAAQFAAEGAELGAAQPLSRLLWAAGLASGKGALQPGLDPDGEYQLRKWPQTEREYPKHFRIATAMMKGPATVAQVAEASGVSREEVCDFVNANLATGFAEFVPPPAPEPDAPAPKPSGLFGRIRGR